MLTCLFKSWPEGKLELKLKFWDDHWFFVASEPLNVSQFLTKTVYSSWMLIWKASTERVPEVDFIEKTSKGTAFWKGGVVDNKPICGERFSIIEHVVPVVDCCWDGNSIW